MRIPLQQKPEVKTARLQQGDFVARPPLGGLYAKASQEPTKPLPRLRQGGFAAIALLWLLGAAACSSTPVEVSLVTKELRHAALTDSRASAPLIRRQEVSSAPTVSVAEQLRQASVDYDSSSVMRGLFRLKKSAVQSPYVHGIDVDVRRGYYAFDCSGMVDWLLQRTSPVASQSLRAGHSPRPLARDFVETIGRLTPGQSRGGWLRVARVSDARPGDVIAWLRPKFIKSQNTGHVAVIILPPELRSPFDSAYLVRVADSSRLRHQDDTRIGGASGFGFGTILVESNPANGAPSGFSFAGERAHHAWGTRVVIGRPLR